MTYLFWIIVGTLGAGAIYWIMDYKSGQDDPASDDNQ
jgi:hypothetical protein